MKVCNFFQTIKKYSITKTPDNEALNFFRSFSFKMFLKSIELKAKEVSDIYSFSSSISLINLFFEHIFIACFIQQRINYYG